MSQKIKFSHNTNTYLVHILKIPEPFFININFYIRKYITFCEILSINVAFSQLFESKTQLVKNIFFSNEKFLVTNQDIMTPTFPLESEK